LQYVQRGLHGITPLRATFKPYTNTDQNLGIILNENRNESRAVIETSI